jgi:hypothetical protein
MSQSMSDEAEHIRPAPVSPDTYQLRTFSQLIANLEEGSFEHDLAQAMTEVQTLMNEAVQDNRKANAAISVKINFKCDRDIIMVDADFTVKMPKPTRRRTLLHISGSAFATRDPRQRDLPLRGLPSDSTTFRSV